MLNLMKVTNPSSSSFIHRSARNISVWLLMVLFSLSADSVYSQIQAESAGICESQKSKWLSEAIQFLLTPEYTEQLALLRIDTYETDSNQLSHRVRLNGKGKLMLENDQWIAMKSHSSHDSKDIGDITVAIENTGRIYISEGHICGGLISFAFVGKEIRYDTDFFFNHFKSDTESAPWIIYKQL